jgi:dynein heavy chain
MGELYGEVDFNTQEWTDGLASKIMRNASEDQTDDKFWTVFDGPVDAIWIENMNTVLDDNMTLCLSNGQRIKLRPQMRMLFEVMDLAVASPATVSRCGMVYLPAEQLGWQPFFESWLERNYPDESIINENEKGLIRDTFLATFDPAIEKIRHNFTELIVTDNLQLAKSVFSFMKVFLDPERGFNAIDPKIRKKDIDSIMAFSFAWGMGASLDEKSKDYFDTFVRDNFKSAQFPTQQQVFDYYYDLKKTKSWIHWDTIVSKFEYVKDMSYFEMMVPTADTVKHKYCLE